MFLSDVLLFVWSPLYWDFHNLTSLKHCFLYIITPLLRTFRNLSSIVNSNTLDVCNKLSSKCPSLTSLAWFIHSFNRYVLTTHLVPVMCFILGIGSEQGRQEVCFHGVYFLEMGERVYISENMNTIISTLLRYWNIRNKPGFFWLPSFPVIFFLITIFILEARQLGFECEFCHILAACL